MFQNSKGKRGKGLRFLVWLQIFGVFDLLNDEDKKEPGHMSMSGHWVSTGEIRICPSDGCACVCGIRTVLILPFCHTFTRPIDSVLPQWRCLQQNVFTTVPALLPQPHQEVQCSRRRLSALCMPIAPHSFKLKTLKTHIQRVQPPNTRVLSTVSRLIAPLCVSL